MHVRQHLSVFVLALVVALAGSRAGASLIGADFIKITASSAQGSGEWKLVIPPGWTFPANGKHSWSLPTPVDIWNGNHSARLAQIQSLDLYFEQDPVVALNFAVMAGAGPVGVTITSAQLSFPAITNPSAVATSAMTLTDTDGNGASLTGQQTGNKAYRATYNTNVDWAFLNNSFNAAAFSSNTSNDRRPAAGFETIVGNVSSIVSQYNFTLSSNDQASGTSTFAVVPEPSVLSLVVFVGLLLRRR
jgi:hypothetical protein